jgi:hypothetical protein
MESELCGKLTMGIAEAEAHPSSLHFSSQHDEQVEAARDDDPKDPNVERDVIIWKVHFEPPDHHLDS